MKINESCINHNAVRLISELTDGVYDLCFTKEEGERRDNTYYALMTLGNIIDVLDMARAMKGVLKA